MKVDITQQPTLRTPAMPRRQFVTPFPVTSERAPVVQPVPDDFVAPVPKKSPYTSVWVALIACAFTYVVGVTLQVNHDTSGFLYTTVIVTLVLLAWGITGVEWLIKQGKDFYYGILGNVLILVLLFMMAWFVLGIAIVLPDFHDRYCPRQQYFCHVNGNPLHGPTWPALSN